MACCGDGGHRTAESAAIDKGIKDQSKEERQLLRVLVLGTSASGKSTLCKQMKILHCNGFTKEELDNYSQILILNIFSAFRELVYQAELFSLKIMRKNKKVASYFTECNPYTEKLDQEVVERAIQLWSDKGIQKMWERRNEIDFPTNLAYMMANITRFAQPNFVPSNDDVLHARQRTTGVVETNFNITKWNWSLIDVGGQRSERRKWIHFFDGVTAVIYCAALDEFDMVCPEDTSKNKMEESLEVFETMINSDFFKDKAFVLFLNKMDLFKEKIATLNLSKVFPEYKGGHEYDAAVNFIRQTYQTKIKSRPVEDVFVHVTCAIDTSNVKYVFDAVSETIFTKRLEISGLVGPRLM